MPKCFFCSSEILPGRGLTIYRADGTARTFCSSKCVRNARLGRKPSKVKWVKKKKQK